MAVAQGPQSCDRVLKQQWSRISSRPFVDDLSSAARRLRAHAGSSAAVLVCVALGCFLFMLLLVLPLIIATYQ